MHPLPSSRARWRHRPARALTALSIVALMTVVAPTTVLAASSTQSSPTSLSGNATLASVPFDVTSALGTSASGTAEITASWTQPASLSTTYDPSLVRQGQTLTLIDAYGRTPTSSLTIQYKLDNLQVAWGLISLSLGSPTFSMTGPCDLMSDTATETCKLSSGQVTLFDSYPAPGPYVKLSLAATVTITPQGIATLRTATFSGTPGGSAPLLLGESPISDALAIPCSVPAGNDLSYALGGLSTTDGLSVDTSLVFDVGAVVTAFPIPEVDASFDKPIIDMGTSTGSIAMTGSGTTFDLGTVQKNNIPPLANAGGPYTGNEGSPISFNGSGSTSICGFPTLQWNFSDGGVAYGEFPQHTFQGPGTYSGLLTATDATGLTTTTTFSVTVNNLPRWSMPGLRWEVRGVSRSS